MANSKKRREEHRTRVVVGGNATATAEIVIPIETFESADGDRDVRWVDIARGFGSVTSYPAVLDEAPSSIALVLDGFAFDLHVGDRFVATGTHDGATFRDIALDRGVDVYLARNIDVRRSTPAGLATAAADGHLVGARVTGFGVDALQLP